MTPWGIRKRLHRWLILKLTGLDFEALDNMEPDPEPPASEDEVNAIPDDSPFLGNEAASLLAIARKSPILAPSTEPLVGSVEERVARTRQRW